MKIINTQEELEALIDDNGDIVIDDDLTINCNIKIEANIQAWDIKAADIEAWDIKAADIESRNIKAGNLGAWSIKTANIEASNIQARRIESRNIKAANIEALIIQARHIEAADISYYAVCFAYKSIICRSIKGRRDNSKHFVLDGTITINNK